MSRWTLVLVAAWGMASCASPDGEAASDGDVFAVVNRVELEEGPDDPMVRVDHVGRRPEGGYVIADRYAGVVRLFDEAGKASRVVGRPGEGPGELEEPSGAVELADGRIVVVQRANPRLTIFLPDGPPVLKDVPGQYGFWVEQAEGGFVAGVATRETRFARFDGDGTALATFGARDPSIATTPFWLYFASEHAAVLGDAVAVSTSLFPEIRLFSLSGDSVGTFGQRPEGWVPVSAAPVEDLSEPGSRERVAEWARSFTIVRNVAAVADTLLVVEYGRYDPQESDPYRVYPTTADVYTRSGERLATGLHLPGPVVGGGGRLLVLVGEPPAPWTIAELEWMGPGQ